MQHFTKKIVCNPSVMVSIGCCRAYRIHLHIETYVQVFNKQHYLSSEIILESNSNFLKNFFNFEINDHSITSFIWWCVAVVRGKNLPTAAWDIVERMQRGTVLVKIIIHIDWNPYIAPLKVLYEFQSTCKQKCKHLVRCKWYNWMYLLIFGQCHP